MEALFPTYAGRTSPMGCCCPASRAHPRLRGADELDKLNQMELADSSPLTRGGRETYFVGYIDSGLIPAYAGRTVPHQG